MNHGYHGIEFFEDGTIETDQFDGWSGCRQICDTEASLLSDKSDHPPVPDAFAALGVRPSILRALAELKYVTPSEIQSMLIPRALAGVDILGQARTGTGKTAAFGIPLLSQCSKGLATQAIILIPTR
jgi:ATP-dependent RNA helicase DeaD